LQRKTKTERNNMSKKRFFLAWTVCLAAVAYGGTDSKTGMENMGGTHWENQDDRSLPLPFSIQAEGDVLLLASDKEAEGISILIKDAQGVTVWSEEGVSVTAGGVTSLFMDSLSAGNYWAVLSWEGMSGVYAFTK
jgi:hypothetical protein